MTLPYQSYRAHGSAKVALKLYISHDSLDSLRAKRYRHIRKARIPPTTVIDPNTIPSIAPTFMTGAEAGAEDWPPGIELVLAVEEGCGESLIPVARCDVLTAVVDKIGEPSVSTKLESARSAF